MAHRDQKEACDSSESDENENYDPRLDFFSDQFDPILALNTPGLKVPDLNAKRYDNLAIYESSAVKEKLQEQNALKKKPVALAGSSTVERRWLPHQMPIKSSLVYNERNVLTRMEAMKGPLALLRKCKDERLKIKVWTRHDRGIRGYCLGYVIAFDKHWNLALEEVTEFWTRTKKSKVPALDNVPEVKREKSRIKPPRITITDHPTNKKLENCMRCVTEFMMRGEHIVLISVVNEEADTEQAKSDIGSEYNFVNKRSSKS